MFGAYGALCSFDIHIALVVSSSCPLQSTLILFKYKNKTLCFAIPHWVWESMTFGIVRTSNQH
jgi:hypothetical protein